ncbi:transmembrane and coiled-coil domain-containing protein 4-like isoform X2 [Bacillus rossius redtenbacheri]|uniref:transmembrane and coiled-coil domain-containing protein 4-like isoform X2 n=1 Tax=Bacillus rossius redtenbacheri TaxID=93214 RepID=UPI002FDD53D5
MFASANYLIISNFKTRSYSQVEPVLLDLFEGPTSQTTDAYVDLLFSEPALDGKAVLVLEDLVLFAVNDGKYDARMRVLIHHVAILLKVPVELVEIYEESAVDYLTEYQREMTAKEKQVKLQKLRSNKLKRYACIGLATLGGGAILGLTGGLAAPLIGAGMGTILGGASAAAIGSTAGIAIIGSLFGVAGAGLTGFKMKKRVGEIEEFAFGRLNPPSELNHSTQQLHITVAISGWLSDTVEDDFTRPWRTLYNSQEQYYLRYESTYLLELGKAMEAALSFAASLAAQEALKYTMLSGIITAIAWPSSLITLASVIDNPWGVCCRRSAEVGKQLAQVLLSKEQGQRPVTLVGFSLGARVIYYCLREMSEVDGCEGIVQDAVLLGAPVNGKPALWEKLTRVVAGNIVNGYCRSDWLLRFLYRTLSVTSEVAGLQPVQSTNRRLVNVDLSDVVSGHSEYPEKIDSVLKVVGVRTRDDLQDLESKLKKSNSDLPASVKAKISLVSLRASKSHNALHTTLGDSPQVTDQTESCSKDSCEMMTQAVLYPTDAIASMQSPNALHTTLGGSSQMTHQTESCSKDSCETMTRTVLDSADDIASTQSHNTMHTTLGDSPQMTHQTESCSKDSCETMTRTVLDSADDMASTQSHTTMHTTLGDSPQLTNQTESCSEDSCEMTWAVLDPADGSASQSSGKQA